MAIEVTAQLETAAFENAIRELARVTGKTLPEVLRHEAGHILKFCVLNTKVAKPAMLTDRAWTRTKQFAFGKGRVNDFGLTMLTGNRKPDSRGVVLKYWGPGRWMRAGEVAPNGRSFVTLEERGGRAIPHDVQVDAADAMADVVANFGGILKRTKQSAGLARQSWVQIADSIGIDLSQVKGGRSAAAAVAKARKAIAFNGRAYQNGTGSDTVAQGNHVITLINMLPYASGAKLDRTLQRAISGRAGYFKNNLRHRVFEDFRTIAAKYPGLAAS